MQGSSFKMENLQRLGRNAVHTKRLSVEMGCPSPEGEEIVLARLEREWSYDVQGVASLSKRN